MRRFGTTPLYLTAGIATSAIRDEWIAGMALILFMGDLIQKPLAGAQPATTIRNALDA
jgi:hypothetical protein